MTTMWVVIWVSFFAVVFAGNMSRWAGAETADLQRHLLPGIEPWTEEERRKYNLGVLIRALLFASVFTFATWSLTRALLVQF